MQYVSTQVHNLLQPTVWLHQADMHMLQEVASYVITAFCSAATARGYAYIWPPAFDSHAYGRVQLAALCNFVRRQLSYLWQVLLMPCFTAALQIVPFLHQQTSTFKCAVKVKACRHLLATLSICNLAVLCCTVVVPLVVLWHVLYAAGLHELTALCYTQHSQRRLDTAACFSKHENTSSSVA